MTSFLNICNGYDTNVLQNVYYYFHFICKYFWYGANITFWHIKGISVFIIL